MPERFKLFSAVYLILTNPSGKILFERRCNTSYMDGKLGFPAGHLDGGEGAKEALAREAKEELSVNIKPQNCQFVHISHRAASASNPREYLDLFFECNAWDGEVKINEPDKCSQQLWLTADEFINHPDAIPYLTKIIGLINSGVLYSEE